MTSITVGGVTFHNSGALDANGVSWLFSDTKGWFDGPPVKGGKTDRPQSHGSFAERAFRDGRTVTITGSVHAPSRALASAAQMTLTALLAGGEFDAFTVDDEDQGVMSAQVQIEAQPLVDWYTPLDIDYQLTFYAPDPLRYGDPVSVSTGFPAPAGGLEYDLFTEGTTPGARENLCTNPQPAIALTGWTGTAVSLVTASWGRKACRSTTSGAGTQYIFTALSGALVPAGTLVTGSATVAFSAGATHYRISVHHRVGNVYYNPAIYLPVPIAGSRVSVSYVLPTDVPAGELDLAIIAYSSAGGGITPAGTTIDVGDVLLGPAGEYFDGSSPGGAWTGTPNASTSTQTTSVGTDTGYLEYGEYGETGRVTITNTGNADATIQYDIAGPVPAQGFEVLLVGTGERLRFEGDVSSGSHLVIDSANGLVLIDGTADRSNLLTWRDWFVVPAGGSIEIAFVNLGSFSAAQLTASIRPGSW